MRKIYFFTLIFILFSQWTIAQQKNDTTDALLFLRKPLININEPNGGYYSDLVDRLFKELFCGAEIENIGDTIFGLNLELVFLDYDKEMMFSTHTNPFDMAYGRDTLIFEEPIQTNDIPNNYRCEYLCYNLKSNDSLIEHCSDTIPFPKQHGVDWNTFSRSSTPNKYVDIKDLGIQSGDFIGTNYNLYDNMVNARFFSEEEKPEGLNIEFQIYQNETLFYSAPVSNSLEWHYPDFYGLSLWDTNYTLGLTFTFDENTSFKIGVDTAIYHNFEVECSIKKGEQWQSESFVLCMYNEYGPESIGEAALPEMKIYPNPSAGNLYFEKAFYKSIEIISLDGQVVKRVHNQELEAIDASKLNNGYYLMKFETNSDIKVAKIQILK